MDSYLKVGIAGYGVVGKKRKKILDNIPGVRVVAISDKNKKNRILNKIFSYLYKHNMLRIIYKQ